MSADDLHKLQKILGMLSSAHEGERLNAATQAEAMRRRLGITWEELLRRG